MNPNEFQIIDEVPLVEPIPILTKFHQNGPEELEVGDDPDITGNL